MKVLDNTKYAPSLGVFVFVDMLCNLPITDIKYVAFSTDSEGMVGSDLRIK